MLQKVGTEAGEECGGGTVTKSGEQGEARGYISLVMANKNDGL